MISFTLSGLMGTNIASINVVAGRGCHSLVSRINGNVT